MLIGARFLCFPDGGCVITYYGQFGVVVVVHSVSVVVVYVATVLVNIYMYKVAHQRAAGTESGACSWLRYDTRCYFNVRSKANMSQLNLPHGTDN